MEVSKMETTSYRLNEEQRKFVEENHNLIYAFAYQKNLNLNEYYDLLAIALCKAACFYDTNCGVKFGAFAFFCMNNECKQYWRSIQGVTRIPESLIYSYDGPVSSKSDEEVELIERLKNEKVDSDITEIYVKDFLSSLDEREQMIVWARINGYSEQKIADALGVSKAYISFIIRGIKSSWRIYNK